MNNITFITGNNDKLREVERILGPVDHVNYDLQEVQGNPEFIVKTKCLEAFKILKTPVLIEDTSLCFNALSNSKVVLPGPYIKWFQKLGLNTIVQLLDNFQDKTAYDLCIYAYCEIEDEVQLFIGKTSGKITSPRGNNGMGWDSIFQPDTCELTYAEMTNIEKDKYSSRSKALQSFYVNTLR